MRLIDADAFIEAWNLNKATKYGNKDADQQRFSYGTMMMYEIADAIEDAPTVEAVPISVIEKIRTDINSLFADYDVEKSCTFGLIDFEHINNIIDQAIKECDT